jgi:fructokinase
METRFTIVGLGEALFDVFPDREILGGAPLNVAVHAHQLATVRGGRGAVVSRLGQDSHGSRVIRELTERGVATEFLQTDPDHATGEVFVEIDDRGQPTYDIVRDVAWDWLQFDPDVEDLARRCDAVCFGSLAQRNGQTRNTIYRFLTACRPTAMRLFDVNLRQRYYDRQILARSCELSTAVKLNEQELPVVVDHLGLTGDDPDALAGALLKAYGLKLVVLTRGERGTVLYTPSQRLEDRPVSYPAAEDADAVGAGDACSAGVLVGHVLRLPPARTLSLANHAGAYVASVAGGTPELPQAILDMVK